MAELEGVSTRWSRAAGSTVKVPEVPVLPVPAWSVAVMVAPDPDWVRVTEWEARTPPVNAADCTHPALHVLLEVTSTVPVNPVTVLLKESWAVTLTLKGVPAVWVPMVPPPAASTLKWSSPASFTVKVLEVPVLPVAAWSVAVMVAPDPASVRVTEWEDSTPAVKAADCTHPALHVWLEVTSTVPVNPGTVL